MESRLSEEVLRKLEAEAHECLPSRPTHEQQSLTDRVRRSLSWLNRAVAASPEDTPSRFLELWISLNALYGRQPYLRGVRIDENADFRHFMAKLKSLDSSGIEIVPLMKRLERRAFSLVGNQYLWKEFWRGERGGLKRLIEEAGNELEGSLRKKDPVAFFACIFERLQTLRNQIVHGSSSVDTTKNRDALVPSLLLLEDMIPIFLMLMIRNGLGTDWPDIPYPGRETPQHQKLS